MRLPVRCLLSISLWLLASSTIAHAALRSVSSARVISPDSEVVCSFTVWGDPPRTIRADPKTNVLYQEGSVLVVADGPRRQLVFRNERDPTKCEHENEVTCRIGTFAERLLAQGKNKTNRTAERSGVVRDRCTSTCIPDVEGINVSFAGTMLGGALHGSAVAPKNVAVVGVGAGRIPSWILARFEHTHVTAIDVDSAVVHASQCFGLTSVSNERLKMVVADGRQWLAGQQNQSFDAVFVDAFDHNQEVPPCMTTAEFFNQIKPKLRPGGVLAMNLWPQHRTTVLPTFAAAFASTGTETGTPPGLGNIITVGRVDHAASHGAPTSMAAEVAKEVEALHAAAHFAKVDVDPKAAIRHDSTFCPHEPL